MTDEYTLSQRAAAEFIGTFSIVFFGAGAVVIDFLTAPEAGGQYVASGLGLGGLGWVGIALAFWGAVAIPIYVLGPVSGQHINPAVTVAFWLTDRIDTGPAVVYVLAQLAGGIGGGLVFTLVRGGEAVTVGAMGATAVFPGVTPLQAVVNEAVITFFLMVTIMAVAVDDRAPPGWAGFIIGFVVAVGVATTGNVSGASFNPARTIGPYVTVTVSNALLGTDGPFLWGQVWIYVVGPIVGAIVGVYTYEYLVLRPHESKVVEGPDDATTAD
ncbi:MAG: MIP/aquaporin family protein [Haloarculaceae archaeon]